ncbi:contractile injection system protein, VgrG/Pvc8 family, partial [Escherichia coli]|uniref:contractile injection system protein, VgrG/Pvc8 family n=1 Tax=Escherichia coli TaxID=562 RepID=UPI002077873C
NTRTEVSTLCISQFRYSAQIRPSSVVTKDYTFKRPGWAGRFEQEGQHQDYQRTQYEVYDYPGRFKGAHGQNFARWQMDGWRNNAETARGMSRSPEIWPGRRIVLTGHPQANLNREEARTSSLSSSDSSRPLSASAFPDTLPGTEYGPDRGIRLSAVWLMHDPAYPESLPAAPLVRYTYTEAGELLAVYDRSNTQVRAFTYDAQHPGRMVAHRYAGRPEMRYRYDDTGRVVEQLNPAGLSYRYLYEQDRITVTDSLNRREVLHTEGGAGLKRVVKKELADGSVTRSGYDAAGRLTAQTDAAGRRTEYGLNVVSGDITDITTPDGRETKFYYNDGNQLTAVVSPDGLESRREYDEPGRLVSETSRSGETVRYRYDDAHSELPATTTDATGSTRQMT